MADQEKIKRLEKVLKKFFTSKTDVLGSYCGNAENDYPTQDADDL